MRVAVNLASRPYVELGPTYRRLRIAIVVFLVLIAPLAFELGSLKQKAASANARTVAAQQRIQGLNEERQAFEASMRRPENAAVLRQSHFLNTVFARKAFSWTAVMMDLENVLPGGVQVLNIDPIISRTGDVTIRMRVSGPHDLAVDLMRNLEHSHRFLYPRLVGETAENTHAQNGQAQPSASTVTGRVDFDILAEYNPLPVSGSPGKAQNLGRRRKSSPGAGSRLAPGSTPSPAAQPGIGRLR